MTAILGEPVRVDYAAIEKSLADLWRGEHRTGSHPVTRAALWNVVAHTWSGEDQTEVSAILSRVAAAVPQRTIVVRCEPESANDIGTWISANCHMVSGEKQVCSEHVSIVAGGDSIERVPPLVSALLLPDMPVAIWWSGRLPSEHSSYVDTLLEPADQLIVDSAEFEAPGELGLVARVAGETITAPADLNWLRLEDWRIGTAALFDPAAMRAKLATIRSIRVLAGVDGVGFGGRAEAVLYSAWLASAAKAADVAYEISNDPDADRGLITRVEIGFDDGATATLGSDRTRHVIVGAANAAGAPVDCVTRVTTTRRDDLLIRQLKRPEADPVFVRILPLAARLAESAVT